MDTCSQTSRDTVYFPLFPRCTKGPCPVLVHVWHIHTQRRLSIFLCSTKKTIETSSLSWISLQRGFQQHNYYYYYHYHYHYYTILYQGRCVSRTRQMYFSPCSLVFVPLLSRLPLKVSHPRLPGLLWIARPLATYDPVAGIGLLLLLLKLLLRGEMAGG